MTALTKPELTAQLRALRRMLYGPAQDEMTPEQWHQATHGGLMGPVMDGTQMTQLKIEIAKLEALLPFATQTQSESP